MFVKVTNLNEDTKILTETDTETFFSIQFFLKPKPRQKSRNREVSKPKCQSLLLMPRVWGFILDNTLEKNLTAEKWGHNWQNNLYVSYITKYINIWHFARWPCVSTRGTGSSKGEWGEHLRSFRFCVILCLKEKPHNLSSFRLCIVLSQRSLGSILLPPPSVRYTRMRKEQEATFAKRESDQIAVGCVIKNKPHTHTLTQAILGALNVQFHICRWSKAPTPRFPSSTGSAPFSPSRSLSFSFSLASSSGLCTMSSKMRATGGPKNLFPLTLWDNEQC